MNYNVYFIGCLPYSTIKRELSARCIAETNRISIPYSTIKRLFFRLYGLHGERFQFLIVQLKANFGSEALSASTF